MRVLMLLYNPVGKGTYWRALQLARGLAKLGHKITVLATPQKRRVKFGVYSDKQPNVTLVESPDIFGGVFRSGWDPLNLLARIGWSHRRNFDVVHGFESRPTVIFPALYWRYQRDVRLVLDWCDWFGRGGSVEERSHLMRTVLRPVETFFEEHFRLQADGTTVINEVLRQRAIALNVPSYSIFKLPNGCNLENLYPLPILEARNALGWPEDVFVIGYIGSIFKKDALLMAQTFDHIHNINPKVRLLIAGYCNVAIENLVAAPDAVWRTGLISYNEINRYLGACDICWLPLTHSGANRGRSPIKLNDYMSVGKPVVSTSFNQDVVDLIQSGAFGLLAPDRSDELARQVLVLLQDSERRELMGKRARHLAELEFSWDKIVVGLEAFYETVL